MDKKLYFMCIAILDEFLTGEFRWLRLIKKLDFKNTHKPLHEILVWTLLVSYLISAVLNYGHLLSLWVIAAQLHIKRYESVVTQSFETWIRTKYIFVCLSKNLVPVIIEILYILKLQKIDTNRNHGNLSSQWCRKVKNIEGASSYR